MTSELYAALDEAARGADNERSLRLLIQNMPRFPTAVGLRRMVADIALDHGMSDDARKVLRQTFDLQVSAGTLLGAIASLREAESLGVDIDPWWITLFDDLEARGFGLATHDGPGIEAADLKADRPVLPLEGLLAVAVELAQRPPVEQVDPRPFTPVPVLEGLPPEELRWTLLRLVSRRAFHERPLGELAEGGIGWVVSGALQSQGRVIHPPADTAFLARNPPLWQATPGLHVLALRQADVDELIEKVPHLGDRWGDNQPRRRLLAALHQSPLVQTLSAQGREALMKHVGLLELETGIVQHQGALSPGLFIVTHGELKLVDRQARGRGVVGTVSVGQLIGEERFVDQSAALLEAIATDPVGLAFLRYDDFAPHIDAEPEASVLLDLICEERKAAAALLDTGEVDLVDDESVDDDGDADLVSDAPRT